MSSDEFHTKYASVMESMLKSAMAETTKLFETMVNDLKAEISQMRKENADLKTRCVRYEKGPPAEPWTDGSGVPERSDVSGKCDTAVQCGCLNAGLCSSDSATSETHTDLSNIVQNSLMGDGYLICNNDGQPTEGAHLWLVDLEPLRTVMVEECQPSEPSAVQNQDQQHSSEQMGYTLQEHNYVLQDNGHSKKKSCCDFSAQSVLKQEEVEPSVFTDDAGSEEAFENVGPHSVQKCSPEELKSPQNQLWDVKPSLVISLKDAFRDDVKEEPDDVQMTARTVTQGELRTVGQECHEDGKATAVKATAEAATTTTAVTSVATTTAAATTVNEETGATVPHKEELEETALINKEGACERSNEGSARGSSRPKASPHRKRGRPPKKRKVKSSAEILRNEEDLNTSSVTEKEIDAASVHIEDKTAAGTSSVITPSVQENANISLKEKMPSSGECLGDGFSKEVREEPTEPQPTVHFTASGTPSSAQETSGSLKRRRTSVSLQDAMLLVEAMNQSTVESTVSVSSRTIQPQIHFSPMVGTSEKMNKAPPICPPPLQGHIKTITSSSESETHELVVIPKRRPGVSRRTAAPTESPSATLAAVITTKSPQEGTKTIVILPRRGASFSAPKITVKPPKLGCAASESDNLSTKSPLLSSPFQTVKGTGGKLVSVLPSQIKTMSADEKQRITIIIPRMGTSMKPQSVNLSDKQDTITASAVPNPTDPGSDSAPELDPVVDTEDDPTSDLAPDADPTLDLAPDADPTSDPAPDADPTPDPAPDADPTPDPAPDADPTPDPTPDPASDADPTPDLAPDADPTSDLAPDADPTSDLAPDSGPTRDPAPDVDPTPELAPDVDPDLSPTPMGSSTQQISMSKQSNPSLLDETVFIKKIKDTADNADDSKQASPFSEMISAPTDTSFSSELLVGSVLTPASSVLVSVTKQELCAVVRLTRLPFPVSTKESVLVSRLSEVIRKHSPPEPPVLSLLETPKKTKVSSTAGTVVKGTAREHAQALTTSALTKSAEATTMTKPLSALDTAAELTQGFIAVQNALDPQLQMTKTQFLAQLLVSPVDQQKELSHKKSLKTTIVARLRSHLKSQLEARTANKSKAHTNSNAKSPKKPRVEDERSNEEYETKRTKAILSTDPDMTRNIISSNKIDSRPLFPRRQSGLCRDDGSAAATLKRSSPGTDGVGSNNEKFTSVSPRSRSKKESKNTTASTSASPRRETSERNDSVNKRSPPASPVKLMYTQESIQPDITNNSSSTESAKSCSVSPQISVRENPCPKITASLSVSLKKSILVGNARSFKMSSCLNSSTFSEVSLSTKPTKRQSSAFSPEKSTVTVGSDFTAKSESENEPLSNMAEEPPSVKTPRVSEGHSERSESQVLNAIKLAKAAKVIKRRGRPRKNEIKAQKIEFAKEQVNTGVVKKCRAQVWYPPTLPPNEVPCLEIKKPEPIMIVDNVPLIPFNRPPIVSPLQPLAVIGRFLLRNQCGECGRILGSSAALESHVSLHKVRRPFSCELCGKYFPDSKSFKRHNRVHRNGRIHICPKCGKGFVYRFGLSKHLQMVHGKIKPFICQICNKGFYSKRDVEVHIRIHTGEKPFHCHLCEKKFTRRVELNVHLRWHNGEKRHWCPHCGKGFLDYNNLKRHKYTHTGEKPYSCPHCPKRFIQTGHMKKHIKNAHNR